MGFTKELSHFAVDLIRCALEQTANHQSRAAQLLGLNATTLNSKIKSYGIAPGETTDCPDQKFINS